MYCKAKRDMIVHGVIVSLKLFANLGASVIVCIEQYLERSYSYETDIGNLADLNLLKVCKCLIGQFTSVGSSYWLIPGQNVSPNKL